MPKYEITHQCGHNSFYILAAHTRELKSKTEEILRIHALNVCPECAKIRNTRTAEKILRAKGI